MDEQVVLEHFERLVKAEASAQSAHRRLDGYNGQIASLRTEVSNLRVEQAKTATKAAAMAAIGGAVGTALMGGVVALVLALVS